MRATATGSATAVLRDRVAAATPPGEPSRATVAARSPDTASFTINGRFLAQPLTGVQRYAREITRAMGAELAGRSAKARLVSCAGVDWASGPGSIDLRRGGPGSGHAWEQLVLPLRRRGPLLSLGNTGPLACRDRILCIHGANVFEQPDSYGLPFRMLYRAMQPRLVGRVRRVTSVSQASARALSRHLPVQARDIVVLPNGHEHVRDWDASRSRLLTRLPTARPFVLLLGSRARHKNIGLVLGLADRLDALGLDLLVAGRRSAIFSPMATASPPATGLQPNVHWLGAVSDDDLAFLYARALCLAFPSLTEGFGLPIVEAMALGCPVVSSDRASMPEVCGDAALQAAPDDPRRWLGHVTDLVVSSALREELRGRGAEQVKRFSWAASARGYLDLLASLGWSP